MPRPFSILANEYQLGANLMCGFNRRITNAILTRCVLTTAVLRGLKIRILSSHVTDGEMMLMKRLRTFIVGR